MFYNRGEVLSDQFDHFKLILFWVPECSFCKKNLTKRDKVGIFRLRGGGVTRSHFYKPYYHPKSEHFRENQKFPNVLKCKIDHNFFLHNHGIPKLGGYSHIFPFFFWQTSLRPPCKPPPSYCGPRHSHCMLHCHIASSALQCFIQIQFAQHAYTWPECLAA